jgi:hypothetical protein
MSLEIKSEPTVLEAQQGQFAVVILSAKNEDYGLLVTMGSAIAVEHGIAPALVQVTPLGGLEDGRYLITVSKSKCAAR